MQRPRVIDKTTTPDGETLTLLEHAGDHFLQLGTLTLMSSAAHHSERHMAEIGCAALAARPGARVLVGGLGMGYTHKALSGVPFRVAERVESLSAISTPRIPLPPGTSVSAL